MDHVEAVQQMATEKYLLDELSPELRDAFEEHFFDCPECAMDVRTAAAFIDEAKVHLPELAGPLSVPATQQRPGIVDKKQSWFAALWQPVFAAPVFAALLIVIGYQNLVTYPALRSAAEEQTAGPVLAPMIYLHSGTRSVGPAPTEVDRKNGIAVVLDRPQAAGYASFEFALADSTGKVVARLPLVNDASATDGTVSLAIPGAALHDGAYTLAISGLTADGARTEIERHSLDIHLKN